MEWDRPVGDARSAGACGTWENRCLIYREHLLLHSSQLLLRRNSRPKSFKGKCKYTILYKNLLILYVDKKFIFLKLCLRQTKTSVVRLGPIFHFWPFSEATSLCLQASVAPNPTSASPCTSVLDISMYEGPGPGIQDRWHQWDNRWPGSTVLRRF